MKILLNNQLAFDDIKAYFPIVLHIQSKLTHPKSKTHYWMYFPVINKGAHSISKIIEYNMLLF